MVMNRLIVCLALIAVVLGCSGGGQDVTGKYKMAATVEPGSMEAQMMEKAILDLKSDKTWEMFGMQGTYTVSGDTLELVMTGIKGMDPGKVKIDNSDNLAFKIEDGGKTLRPTKMSAKFPPPKDARFVRM